MPRILRKVGPVALLCLPLMLLGSRCNVQGQESDMNDATSNDAARAGDAGDGKPEAKAQGDDKQPRKASGIFAAGCFWGVEHKFQNTEGVLDAVSGYVGGTKDNPTYRQVCTGRTGHAEAVRVTYDPAKISYDELLETFWNLHDPTQVNRQGPDFGTQYRSAIFYLNEEQKKTAEASRKALESSGRYNRPIATEITEAGTFWPAEEYHQDYIAKKGGQVCH